MKQFTIGISVFLGFLVFLFLIFQTFSPPGVSISASPSGTTFGTSGVVTGAAASWEAYAIAIDSTSMYVAGRDDNIDWRIEKRLLSDGNLVVVGGTTLTWTVSGATSCTASGDWSGAKSATGGSEYVTPATAGTKTYTLSCTGTGGTTEASATITVL